MQNPDACMSRSQTAVIHSKTVERVKEMYYKAVL